MHVCAHVPCVRKRAWNMHQIVGVTRCSRWCNREMIFLQNGANVWMVTIFMFSFFIFQIITVKRKKLKCIKINFSS